MTTAYDTFITNSLPTWPEPSVKRGVLAMYWLAYMDAQSFPLEELHYYLRDDQMLDLFDYIIPKSIPPYEYQSVPAGAQAILDAIPAYRERIEGASNDFVDNTQPYSGGETNMTNNLAVLEPKTDLIYDVIKAIMLTMGAPSFDDSPLTTLQRSKDMPWEDKQAICKLGIVDNVYEFESPDATFTALQAFFVLVLNQFEQADAMPSVGAF